MTLDITRNIIPPLGHLAPAKQDSVYSASSFDISTLPSKAQQALPAGFEVLEIVSGSAAQIYGWSGSGWEDMNGDPVTSTNITGTVHFRNPATYDIEFVW